MGEGKVEKRKGGKEGGWKRGRVEEGEGGRRGRVEEGEGGRGERIGKKG